MLSIIVAMTADRVIGKDNALPWHISDDLKRFKKITMGHPIIMGRKTFESIGKPLPGRENIIITRNKDYTQNGCTVVHSLDEAIQKTNDKEIFVIGGAEIFKEALPKATKLYLTLIHKPFDGNVHFPAYNLERDYTISAREDHLNSDPPYSYVTATKK